MLLLRTDILHPNMGIYGAVRARDETISELYNRIKEWALLAVQQSAYLTSKAIFSQARESLNSARALKPDWADHLADRPNEAACSLASRVLDKLEANFLPPTRLMPSVEGGIALSFVEEERRAEIEVYNTGEVIAATYAGQCEPVVWALADTEHALETTIDQIRVHLTA